MDLRVVLILLVAVVGFGNAGAPKVKAEKFEHILQKIKLRSAKACERFDNWKQEFDILNGDVKFTVKCMQSTDMQAVNDNIPAHLTIRGNVHFQYQLNGKEHNDRTLYYDLEHLYNTEQEIPDDTYIYLVQ